MLAFWERCALYEFDGEYRWNFQVLCYIRDGVHLPLMESFFTRLLQSYVHLGGVNSYAAGISAIAAQGFGLQERMNAYDHVNLDVINTNVQWGLTQLKKIAFVKSEKKRVDIEKELGLLLEEIRKKEIRIWIRNHDLVKKMLKVLHFWIEQVERELEVDRQLAKYEELFNLHNELQQMILDGRAEER